MKNLNLAQTILADQLVDEYGINREDILFFDEKPEPVLMFPANCALLNRLVNPANIQDLPYETGSPDTVAREVIITLADGRQRASVGVVNLRETIEGKEMSDPQRKELAASRAMRGALLLANIDLIKIHQSGGNLLEFTTKTNKASLLGQAHLLGRELFWIVKTDDGEEKAAWHFQLKIRYGKDHSNELSDVQLADFCAFMRGLLSQPMAA